MYINLQQVTSQLDVHSLIPTFGQLSGGTLVTAVGLIPSIGVEVYLNSSDGVMSPVEHNIEYVVLDLIYYLI